MAQFRIRRKEDQNEELQWLAPRKNFWDPSFFAILSETPCRSYVIRKWSGSEIVSYRESKSAPSPRRERLVYMCQNVTNNTGCFILIPFYSLRFVKTIPINHPLEKRTLSNEGVSRQRSNVIFVEIRTCKSGYLRSTMLTNPDNASPNVSSWRWLIVMWMTKSALAR